MEGINHIYIVQISGGCLIGQIHRVLQRQVPYRKGLKFGIARLDSPLILMVELGQTGGHLAAARSGRCDDHQRTACFNIIILPVSFIADDERNIAGIAVNAVVAIGPNTHVLQLGTEHIRSALAAVLGDHHAAHIQALVLEFLNQAQNIHIIGDSQVLANLVLFDIRRVDGDDDFCLIRQLQEHAQFAVRREAGKNTGGVVVIKEFSSKLQIELIAELADALSDML